MSSSSFPLPLSDVPNSASANTLFAGPTSGGAAAPTFRTAVAADLGTGTPTSGYALVSAGSGVEPAWTLLQGTAVGFITGKDRQRTAAATTNIYFSSDTNTGIEYLSNGSSYAIPGAGYDKVAMGQIAGGVGGFTDTTYFASAAALSVAPHMKSGTFALMFYVNSLPGAVNQQLAGYSSGNITSGWALKVSATNANQMACLFTGLNSTGNILLSGTALTTGVHCFIFTYDSATTIKFCLDGGTVNSATVSGTFTAPTSSASFGIGRFLGAGGLSCGWFDYVGLSGWNSVLSDGEMQTASGSPSTFRFGNTTADPDFFHYASWCSLAGAGGGAAVWPISGAASVRASYMSAQGSGMNKANY